VRDWPAFLGHEIRKHQPTLSSREALLVEEYPVGLDRDTPGEEDLQLNPLAVCCPDFASI
jgi:hypothetical protein